MMGRREFGTLVWHLSSRNYIVQHIPLRLAPRGRLIFTEIAMRRVYDQVPDTREPLDVQS
jgi:hypothetical protein